MKHLKSLLNMTPVILFAVTLMQLYRANMELKYNYEALAWQTKNKTDQLDVITATLFRRAHQCHRSFQDQPAGVESKPATPR